MRMTLLKLILRTYKRYLSPTELDELLEAACGKLPPGVVIEVYQLDGDEDEDDDDEEGVMEAALEWGINRVKDEGRTLN